MQTTTQRLGSVGTADGSAIAISLNPDGSVSRVDVASATTAR